MRVINLPLITVVTVVLNDAENIESTIQSVINQSYSNVEYIIVDGVSTDGTIEKASKYKDRITFISEPDNGLYDAMNKGTERANGEWIIYMNSGDRFYDSNVLTNIFIDYSDKIFGKDVIYTDSIAEYKDAYKRIKPRKLSRLWIRNLAVHQSIIVKTSFAKARKFNLHIEIAADYDFIYYLYKIGAKFIYIDDVCISRCIAYEGYSKTANPFKILWQASLLSIKYSKLYLIPFIIIFNSLTYFYAISINLLRRSH